MSVYVQHLPDAFPYIVQMRRDRVRECVIELMAVDRQDVLDGSSFAVTVENPLNWRLWLSETSYRYLTHEMGMLEGTHIWESRDWKRRE